MKFAKKLKLLIVEAIATANKRNPEPNIIGFFEYAHAHLRLFIAKTTLLLIRHVKRRFLKGREVHNSQLH